jgi:hypothetical protein
MMPDEQLTLFTDTSPTESPQGPQAPYEQYIVGMRGSDPQKYGYRAITTRRLDNYRAGARIVNTAEDLEYLHRAPIPCPDECAAIELERFIQTILAPYRVEPDNPKCERFNGYAFLRDCPPDAGVYLHRLNNFPLFRGGRIQAWDIYVWIRNALSQYYPGAIIEEPMARMQRPARGLLEDLHFAQPSCAMYKKYVEQAISEHTTAPQPGSIALRGVWWDDGLWQPTFAYDPEHLVYWEQWHADAYPRIKGRAVWRCVSLGWRIAGAAPPQRLQWRAAKWHHDHMYDFMRVGGVP